MFKFEFSFLRLKSKLTGFRLRLKTLNKTVNFQFSVASKRKLEMIPVCSYKRYTTLRNTRDVVGYFGSFQEFVSN